MGVNGHPMPGKMPGKKIGGGSKKGGWCPPLALFQVALFVAPIVWLVRS